MWSSKITLILALTTVASVRSVTETVWAQDGEITELRCPLEFDNACLWRFGGKTFMNTTKVDEECVLEIEAKKEIAGKWTCVSANDFYIDLKLADVPKEDEQVTLELPENYANRSEINVTCSIDQSEPKPTFSWFIDDIELTDPKTFDAELSQTIELELTADRSNKTLKCLVNFGKTLPELEQSEVLNYVYDKDFKDTIIKPVIDVVTANAYPAIIAITIVVCFIVLTVGACYKCKIICFKRTVGTDAEKGEKADSDTEKIDLTKEERGEDDEESEEQVAKPTLKARVASFFRVNKGFTADEEKATTEENKENDDITKENGDAKIDMKDDEKETEKEEPIEEATTEDKVIIEKEKTTGKSYRSFIAKMFKRDSVSDKKGEEPVKMENEETTEDKPEEQPKEEEEKKVVEDKNTTETKEEEKEPTPNTSF